MLKEGLRAVAIILLLIIIVMDDFPFYNKLKDQSVQLMLGVLVLACIYFDTTFGFIMGLVLLVIYYEIYKKIILTHEKQLQEELSVQQPKESFQIPATVDYISDNHLLAAQNNVFDVSNFENEIKYVDGYGAQGIGLGYDKDDSYYIWNNHY